MAVSNVNLTAPQPPQYAADIQAQLVRQALSQQIAQGLLAQSMQQDSPVIHSGGSNPFARDVANFGSPLAHIAQAYFGKSMSDDANNASLALAQQGQARQQAEQAGVDAKMFGTPGQVVQAADTGDQGAAVQDALQAVSGGLPVPVSVGGQAPDINAAMAAMGQATSPGVQAQRGPMLEAIVKGLLAQQATPESAGRILGQVTAPSYAASIKNNNLLGIPVANPGDWVNKSKEVTGAGGAIGTITPEPGAQVKPAGVLQPPRQPILVPGAPAPAGAPTGNPTKADMTYDAAGEPRVLNTPTTRGNTEAQEGGVKNAQETLAAGKQNIQAFQNMMPVAVGAMKLLETAGSGKGQTTEWINQAQQFGRQVLGLTNDDAGQISDVQTLTKYLAQQATSQLKGISARPNLVEYQQSMAMNGADPATDKRAVRNVIVKFLADGMNMSDTHQQNMKDYSGILGPEVANTYAASVDPDSVMNQGNLEKITTPIGISQGAGGKWYDSLAGTQASHLEPGSAAARAATGAPKPDTIYKKNSKGQWVPVNG